MVLREEISPAAAAGLVGGLASLPALSADLTWARGAAAQGAVVPFVTGPLLLMGIGWPAAALLHRFVGGRARIHFRVGNWVEVLTLLLAALHGFFLAFKGVVTLWDTGILAAAFFFYLALAVKLEPIPAAEKDWLTSLKSVEFPWGIVWLAAALAAASAAVLFAWRLSPAWIMDYGPWSAAALRELPVFLTALFLIGRGRPQPGLRVLIAAQVVQATLGLGMIPVAALFTRSLLVQPLSPEQVAGVALCAAMTFFGLLSLSGLTLRLSESAALGIFVAAAVGLGEILGFYELGALVLAGCALLVLRRRSETGRIFPGGG